MSQPLPSLDFALPLPSAMEETPAVPATRPAPAPTAPPPSAKWNHQPADCFLPNGDPLRLTISRKLMLLTLFPEIIGCPVAPYECVILLFLCAHDPSAWNTPVPDDEGLLSPLWTREHAFKSRVDEWMDHALDSYEPRQVIDLAQRLWLRQHQSQVMALGEDSPAEKKSSS